MAVVNTCPYCNRSMSSDLIWCPHCEKIYPRTVACYICYQAVNTAEAIVNRKRTTVDAYYHPSCYREVLKEQTCPTCSYTFSEEEQNNFGQGDNYWNHTSCPNCGQRGIEFFDCSCRMKGFRGKAAHVRAKDHGIEDNSSYHRACVSARQMVNDQKGEESRQLLARRRESRRCLSCGKKIGFWSSWFEGGKCLDCRTEGPYLE